MTMQTTVAVVAWIVTGASIRKGASIGLQASIGTGWSVQSTMAVMAISDVAVLAGGRPAGQRDLGAMTMLRAMRAGAAAGRGGRTRGRRPAGQLHHHPGNVAAGRGSSAGHLLLRPEKVAAGMTTVMTALILAAS